MKEKRTIKSVEGQIISFFRRSRRMPSYEEMLDLLGVRSKSVVHFWINKLLKEGVLEKDARGRLSPARRMFGIPVAGEVAAGFPSPAEEELCDMLSLDDYLVTRPEASFLLHVSGDSMTGEGIKEGDMVVVEKERAPGNGDIVIAEVDGEWTMKYFYKDAKGVRLEPANKTYPTIRPRRTLAVEGVVSSVIRKLA